jgi:hypothetical protein
LVLLSGCSNVQRLVRFLGVIELNPVCNHSDVMLGGINSVKVNTLLFEGSNHPLHEPILLVSVGGDEHLQQTLEAH